MYEQLALHRGSLLGETVRLAVDGESLVSLRVGRGHRCGGPITDARQAARRARYERRGTPVLRATCDDVYDPDMNRVGTRTVPSFVDACLLALAGTALIAGVASAQPASGFYLSQEIGPNVGAALELLGNTNDRPSRCDEFIECSCALA